MYKNFEVKIKDEELNHWNQLKEHNVVPIKRFIYNIDVDNIVPYKYAVTTETEVQIYSCDTNSKPINLGNFKNATCCKFRSDGNMVLVGTKTGQILLISPKMVGKIIHSLSAHTGEITKIEYLHIYDPIQKYSASISEDGTLQIWDVVTNTRLHNFDHSNEPLRGLALTKSNPDLIATGSLDGFIRLYNYKLSQSPIVMIDTKVQVNCLLFALEFDSNIILSAGKSTLQLWDTSNVKYDIDNKALPVKSATPHYMQITDICVANALYTGERIVFTSGLDGMVKIIALGDFREIIKYDYPSSLMSVRVLPNCEYLVVAGNDNSDSSKSCIYTRKFFPIKTDDIDSKVISTKVNHKDIVRMSSMYCTDGDMIPITNRLNLSRPTKYEKLFRKHKYRAILNAMLKDQKLYDMPEMFQYLIRELDNSRALKRALVEQNEVKLNYLFRYLKKFMSNPTFTSTGIRVLDLIMELYPPEVLVRQREFISLKNVMKKTVKSWQKLECVVFDIKEILWRCAAQINNKN